MCTRRSSARRSVPESIGVASVAAMADFTDAILKGANLAKANLKNAVLEGADLEGADLSRSDLRGAVLPVIDLAARLGLGSEGAGGGGGAGGDQPLAPAPARTVVGATGRIRPGSLGGRGAAGLSRCWDVARHQRSPGSAGSEAHLQGAVARPPPRLSLSAASIRCSRASLS